VNFLRRLKLTPTHAAFRLEERAGESSTKTLSVKQGEAAWGTSGQGVGEKGRFSDEKSESKENIIGG
jgi:hypothetical protein